MEPLPVDTSNPAVQEYLALVRLQALTPLSLLINIASILVCTVIVRPSIIGIIKLYPTSISPHPAWLSVYVLLIYIFQVGYCLLLVGARRAETKKAMVKAVGYWLELANWAMALWAIAWVSQMFILSTILLGIITLLLIYSNIALLVYHAPTYSRPFDMALIHAPIRFFMVLPLTLMVPYSLFINLGFSYSPAHPEDYVLHAWSGFTVITILNLLSLFFILLRRDVIWAIASTWICVSIWAAQPKPAPVTVAAVLFTVLHPVGVIVMLAYDQFLGRQGRIALAPDQPAPQGGGGGGGTGAVAAAGGGGGGGGGGGEGERRAREVDAEAVWGST